jgi:hypothetical protein
VGDVLNLRRERVTTVQLPLGLSIGTKEKLDLIEFPDIRFAVALGAAKTNLQSLEISNISNVCAPDDTLNSKRITSKKQMGVGGYNTHGTFRVFRESKIQ